MKGCREVLRADSMSSGWDRFEEVKIIQSSSGEKRD